MHGRSTGINCPSQSIIISAVRTPDYSILCSIYISFFSPMIRSLGSLHMYGRKLACSQYVPRYDIDR